MRKEPLSVLVVEDSDDDALLVLRELRRAGYRPKHKRVDTPEALHAALEERAWDAVICDYRMPKFSVSGALKVLRKKCLDLPFIVVSGAVGEDIAVETMKFGAHDYLMKDNLTRLGPAVDREVREARVRAERRRAERALRESEELYRTLVDTSPDAIMLTDLEGNILKANRQTAILAGCGNAEEIIGRKYSCIIAPKDRARARENLKRTLKQGALKDVEYTLLRENGCSCQGEMNSSAIMDPDGKPNGFLAVVRNITERKRMQASLAQADRMASVGTLAAGVAHEINNPLAFVLYNLQSIAEDLPKVTAALGRCWSALVEQRGLDEAREVLGGDCEICEQDRLNDLVSRANEADQGSCRIRDIVRDLRTFSRVGEDRRTSVHLYQVIEAAINMVFIEIKYRARIVKEYGSAPPVFASEGRLSQVFLNLLVNAAHAIDEGDVEHNEIRVRTWTEDGEVLAEIRDTGRGIRTEHLDHLFDPFFTTKPVGVGSGLGLSICHNIVHAYGGRIEVESEVGRGSSFIVRLPVMSADQAEHESEPTGPVGEEDLRPETSGRILVVDDEPLVGSAIRRALCRVHEVVVAESGAQGKELLEEDADFDLILCDLMMPAVSGMDLYEWVAEKHPDLLRRMVFITGGAFTPRAMEFINRVENLRVEKPFDPKNLRTLIRDLLSPSGKRDQPPE